MAPDRLSRIWAVAAKEFRHMLHDRFTLALTFGVPVLQLILYGYALEARIRNVPAAVLNHDTHAAGRALESRLRSSPLFAVGADYKSAREVESALRTGTIRVAVEIPEDYTSRLLYGRNTGLNVWVDGSDVVTSSYLLAALDSLGFAESSRRDKLRLLSEVEIRPTVLFNPAGRTAVFLLPGLVAILVQMITTLLLAVSITAERERGTLEQMLVSRMGANPIIAGKCLAVGAIGLLESCALVLLMRGLFGVTVQGSLLLLASILPLLVLSPIGFGLLIASFARNQTQALQLSHLVFLPSVMLSGFVFPREFLNFPLGWVSNLLPSTYLVALMRNVVLRGASGQDVASGIAVATAFGTALTVAGWIQMRRSMSGDSAGS